MKDVFLCFIKDVWKWCFIKRKYELPAACTIKQMCLIHSVTFQKPVKCHNWHLSYNIIGGTTLSLLCLCRKLLPLCSFCVKTWINFWRYPWGGISLSVFAIYGIIRIERNTVILMGCDVFSCCRVYPTLQELILSILSINK